MIPGNATTPRRATPPAERAGMLQQAYARIETGGRNDPVMSTAESIADALKTTLESLRSNSPKRKAKR